MKIVVFSDLHANKQSLQDIEPELKDADLSIFCGDILGYGQDLEDCIDFIFHHVDLVVLGNHDRMSITQENLNNQHPLVRDSIEYTRKRLSDEQILLLSSLKPEIYFENMYIIHSLGDDYLRSEKDLMRLINHTSSEIKYIFFGHTHEKAFFEHNGKTIINPGSITKGRNGFKRGYVQIDDDEIKFIDLEDIL
ncbi:metallophosphoesterase family protein [Methanobacterium aggregans]|uniref:metallophosphoesterase family protein n=1 Tax=Methanobacterium aggregans TaxID=1615586 RepID=UPI001AE26527|nr:metallophosphoesterase family protein [Methanobacterium aggregans]MBP2046772.1 putative phosphoesterase [Methanobacterium aggregans]